MSNIVIWGDFLTIEMFYCEICGHLLEEDDYVVLIEWDTIIHHFCFSEWDDIEMDSGTLKEMIERYELL